MLRRNPWNQPKPAEWATMSKKLRRAWNRAHWRPHDYMVEVPLKRYATRKANQKDGGAGRGMLKLAAKIERMRAQTNPGPRNAYWTTLDRQIARANEQIRAAEQRFADQLERARLRVEALRIRREETVRPLRDNPKRRRSGSRRLF